MITEATEKQCGKCVEVKPLDEFYKLKHGKFGRAAHCKKCYREYSKKYRKENPEKIRQSQREWRDNNSELRKELWQKWWEENKVEKRAQTLKWRNENKERWNDYFRQYQHEYHAKNLNARIAKNLRSRFRMAFKNGAKNGSAIKFLGCSLEEFRVYLENLFKPGMTWENWSLHGWHLDHIIPFAAFDLTDLEQVKKACHYSNLQPLWAEENLKKSDSILSEAI